MAKPELVPDPETLTVTIDGRDIPFTPPHSYKGFAAQILAPRDKTSQGLERIRSAFDWFGAGIAEEDYEWVKARLLDPTNTLEVGDVLRQINAALEEVLGSPTRPSQP